MKNTSIYLPPLFLLLFLFACKKDEPITPPPVGEEEGDPADTITAPEDTLDLLAYRYTYGDTTDGFVQGIWQDSFLWEATGIALIEHSHTTDPDAYVSILFKTHETEQGFERESLIISEIPKNTQGTYKISLGFWDLNDGFAGSRFFTSMDGGDVSEDSYRVDETAPNNQLTITEVDTAEQIYQGHFTVSFQISTTGGKKNPDNPDHFTIRGAEFWVRVIE